MDNLPCLTRPVRLALVLAAVLSSGACSESLQQALQPDQTQNFGEQFFNIMCQRVAYTSSRTGHQASLAANKKDPSVPVRPLDVSGQEYRLACRYGPQHLPAPARARDPKVWTLVDGRNKGDTGPSNRKLLVDALNNMFLGSSKVSPTQEAKLLSDVQDYLVKLLPKVREGGLILGHNMQRPAGQPEYVEAITTDPALETLFLHMEGAGMSVTMKKKSMREKSGGAR